MQYGQPGYYPGVNALGLARGDQQGSWMLNFPFPYAKPEVQAQFAVMCARLDEALAQERGAPAASAVRAYLDAKRVFRKLVSPDDYTYFSFQLWQEGIARYTELRMGELASAGYEPSPAIAALPDFTSYAAASRVIRDRLHAQLATVKLQDDRRSAFYPVGAAEGLLLDRVNPAWRSRYFGAGFTLDGLLDVGGMAAVYAATHKNGRRVAVKLLPQDGEVYVLAQSQDRRQGHPNAIAGAETDRCCAAAS